jgi:hypothetical protein
MSIYKSKSQILEFEIEFFITNKYEHWRNTNISKLRG